MFAKTKNRLSKNFTVKKSDECNNPFYKYYQKIALIKYITYVFSLLNQPLDCVNKKVEIVNISSKLLWSNQQYSINKQYTNYAHKPIHEIALVKNVTNGPVFFPSPIRNQMPFNFKLVFGVVEMGLENFTTHNRYEIIPITSFFFDTLADETFIKSLSKNKVLRTYPTTAKSKQSNKKKQFFTKYWYLPLDPDKKKEAAMVRQAVQGFYANRENMYAEFDKLVYQQMKNDVSSKSDKNDVEKYIQLDEKINFNLGNS